MSSNFRSNEGPLFRGVTPTCGQIRGSMLSPKLTLYLHLDHLNTETLASVFLVNQHKGKHMSNSAVIEPTKGLCGKEGLLLARSLSDLGDDFIPIRLANFSDDPLKISKNTFVATGQPA